MMKRPLGATEGALRAWFESVDPTRHGWAADELQRTREAIERDGAWTEQDEWRISTMFDSRITVVEVEGRAWFAASVECDGQRLSCRCPSVERAFLFVKLYQHLIRSQFYSIGPPWADVAG
jgi:hypothetical protein